MIFSRFKRNSLSLLVVTISLSGWVISLYIYNDLLEYHLRVSEGKVINAYNILATAFKRTISADDIYSKVSYWMMKGDSAEIGSLTTICDNNPSMLLEASPAFTDASILRVCNTIK